MVQARGQPIDPIAHAPFRDVSVTPQVRHARTRPSKRAVSMDPEESRAA